MNTNGLLTKSRKYLTKENKKEIIIFEADFSEGIVSDKDKKYIKGMKHKYDIDIKVLPFCVFDTQEKKSFYLNRNRKSSSLFKIDPKAVLLKDGFLWVNYAKIGVL